MTIRTVRDLLRELEDLNSPDAPVFIAWVAPKTRIQFAISKVAGSSDGAVYIGEGRQTGFVPSDVVDQMGGTSK